MVRTKASVYKKRRTSGYRRPSTRSPPDFSKMSGTVLRNIAGSAKLAVLKNYDNGTVSPKFMLSTAGGIVSQSIATNDPSCCTDWTSYSSLYDSYKVIDIRLKYLPAFNDNFAGAAQVPYVPLIIYYDEDTSTPVASMDLAIQYGNSKIKSLMGQWNYEIKNKTATDNSISNAGMSVVYNEKYGIMLDVAQVANYQKGIIGWYAAGAPVTTVFGHIAVEYVVLFCNRR